MKTSRRFTRASPRRCWPTCPSTSSGVNIEEMYPSPLPDLFAGTQLIALGGYDEGGAATLTLRGDVNGEPREFSYPVTFAKSGGSEFLPRLWATRKIGYLLNQIRLHGENESSSMRSSISAWSTAS